MGLTAWVAARAEPLIERWQNRERRAAIQERVKNLAADGFLPPILNLLADQASHKADADGLLAAQSELARLDFELSAITSGGGGRTANAARLGQEIAAGAGLLAIAAVLILAALG